MANDKVSIRRPLNSYRHPIKVRENLNHERYSHLDFVTPNSTRSRETRQWGPWGMETRMVYSTKYPMTRTSKDDSKIIAEGVPKGLVR